MPNINPRIRSLDDLLGVARKVENTAATEDKPAQPGNNEIQMLPPEIIRGFRGHPFRLYEGDRFNDLVDSVSENGVLSPTIIRKIEPDENGFEYEMLAGHNRQNAAIAAKRLLPCIVKENLSDQDAWIYVIETNVLQRSFSEMFPSERAAVLALRYSKMICQGRRNDIIHAHMETVLNIEKTLQFIAALPAEDMEARKIDRQLEKLKADYEQTMRFKMSAYEKFVDHLLNEDEFKQYQRIYTEKCEAIAAAISKRQEELDAIVRAGSPQGEWIAHFKSFRHVDVMERKILVKIIDRIYVYEGNRIEIIFKYQNEYRAAAAYIEQYMERQATQAASTVKEAV